MKEIKTQAEHTPIFSKTGVSLFANFCKKRCEPTCFISKDMWYNGICINNSFSIDTTRIILYNTNNSLQSAGKTQ